MAEYVHLDREFTSLGISTSYNYYVIAWPKQTSEMVYKTTIEGNEDTLTSLYIQLDQ
jgi:hypothetical protein